MDQWRACTYMSMHPRDLPVYQAPTARPLRLDTTQVWGLAPEGFAVPDSAGPGAKRLFLGLPTFYAWGPATHFVDVFLSCRRAVAWRVSASPKWLLVSTRAGNLTAVGSQQQQRLLVSIDWRKVPRHGDATGFLVFEGAGKSIRVAVRAAAATLPAPATDESFIETNGYVSMLADHYTRKMDKPTTQWTGIAALGRAGQALQARPLQAAPVDSARAATVEYDFYTLTAAVPVVTVFTLPTHAATWAIKQCYGVSLDGGPLQVVDFQTVGRSDEWKQNVLRNSAQRQVTGPLLDPGRHTLRLYWLDPGVVLDRITIDLGGLRPAYSAIPETRRAGGVAPASGAAH